MNFDMYSNKQHNDNLDASYIYPRPYIDPMMYVNSSNMQTNPNTMGGYMTYMNPFMNNPFIYPGQIDSGMYPGYIDSYDYNDEYNHDDMYTDMMPGMIPPNMMQMMMMQMMMCGQMQPMMPGMAPMMPYMMMPGMAPINMEEFDEEEM